ncbi:MAG: glycosyltransferase family 2 protein, partial [Lachnospiraceae bacterium]|nr:glycosyltransferase family 2 protein [Lachnospiraceae bacterium]
MTVDVIIPVYKPGEKLIQIIKRLHRQTVKLNKLILINTEKRYFDEFFADKTILNEYDDIVIEHISSEEFNHGATRRMGVDMSEADYFVCMTDDAVPLDDMLLEQLISPLEKGIAAAVYARQCASKKCSDIERFTRKFNYPDESRLKSKRDISRLG